MSVYLKKHPLLISAYNWGSDLLNVSVDPEIYFTRKETQPLKPLSFFKRIFHIKQEETQNVLPSKKPLHILANKISNTAFPIFYYYNRATASIVDASRVMTCSARCVLALRDKKNTLIKKNFYQLSLSISSLAISFFAYPIKLAAASTHDIYTNGKELIYNHKKLSYKKIFFCSYQLVINSMFISLLVVDSLEISIVTLFMQVTEGLSRGAMQFYSKHYIENAIYIIYSALKSKNLYLEISDFFKKIIPFRSIK